MDPLIQKSIPPLTDLREMVRQHIVRRSLACMEKAAERREEATQSSATLNTYKTAIRESIHRFYGNLPAGETQPAPQAELVSTFSHNGFRVENVLFESFPGWQVNASVYVPTDYEPPFPAVIVPVGHSGKQFESYQLPCQYFARSGFVAVCFDPPGQRSEKQPGNDHFNDGVRDYPLGKTSSRYFVADALRCIDYLATRDDIDMTRGIAMTGVSGGGTTTTFAVGLDDRISVIGPSCCVAPLAAMDITQCYAGCPETHQFGRYSEGIDEVDLLCATAPKPCLLMAGETDEVFRIEDSRRLAEIVARFYECNDAGDRFEFFVDSGGHAYTLRQAREFTGFMNCWLLDEPDRPLLELAEARCSMLPYKELQCSPRTDINMRTRAVAEADQLAEQRELKPQQIREAAAEIAGITGSVPVPDAEIGEPFQVWVHDWRSLMLRPEPDIELPATWLTGRGQQPATTLLHFDDNGRHRMLRRGGILTGAMRFIDRDRQPLNLLTVDLRGWGDTRPTMYPYEMAGWGSVDRYVAYATAALGDHIMAMRIRDALGTLAWLKEQPEVDPSRIILTGSGLGSMVALHAAAIDKNIGAVVTSEGLSSFRSLLEAANYPWPADTFMPNALNFYDLPELAAALTCPVRAHALRDGTGAAAGEKELTKWQEHDHIVAKTEGESGSLRKSIEELANRSEAIINLQERQPFLWVNPHWQPANQCLHSLPMAHNDIEEAEARWQRFAPLLEKLFPELRETNGIIESDLLPAPSLAKRILPPDSGKLMVKADHALPVAGSIKARGGIYAVLHFAESVALENGLLENKEDDYLTLSSDEAKQVFHTYELSVASTGNLGLSIGITGSALGFPVTVHMSHEAKEWKKERLRHRDVNVIEHQSDYTAACKVARQEAADNPRNHFIDDENSVELFLGYATALPRLKHQLTQAGITIDSEHPLFIYLPCGVGGAPGGITFAARHVFGDDAHCFFVEPVDAPCMTLGLLSERHFDTSIYALGLDLETDADGLAVSRPSRFVGKLMVPLLSGCCTMEDEAMYRHVLDLYETESIEVEPSAAAGCVVPWMLFETDAGRQYLEQHTLTPCLPNTTHLVWTTGGLFVPPKQHQHFRDIARKQKKR